MNEINVVCGAGGFIGGHLTKALTEQGLLVRAVDIKPWKDWFQQNTRAQICDGVDLRKWENCQNVLKDASRVYNLAADMGGMGFIEHNKAKCMLSVLINTHLLQSAVEHRVKRFFFASSACVYNSFCQRDTNLPPLEENDAYPALPEDGYGWEKLFSERMCRHFTEDMGLQTRVARLHNVYGPWGTYAGGREKAPAALCRKVIQAKLSGQKEIEIWGDGEQTRSFMWIKDCITGIQKLMNYDHPFEPVNLGSSELVTINELVNIIEKSAGIKLVRKYNLSAPLGVRGRNSDNTRLKALLNWEPTTRLSVGMKLTYEWIYKQMTEKT